MTTIEDKRKELIKELEIEYSNINNIEDIYIDKFIDKVLKEGEKLAQKEFLDFLNESVNEDDLWNRIVRKIRELRKEVGK